MRRVGWIAAVLCAALSATMAPAVEESGSCDAPVLMTVLGQTTDRAKLAAYAAKLRDSGIYAAHDGWYLAAGRPLDIFEGRYPDNQSLVLARFPCLAAARAFWYSDLYQKEIMPLRAGGGDFQVAVYAEREPPAQLALARLLEWFPGEFDNASQVEAQRAPDSTTLQSARHDRVHAIHHPVALPAFGPHVYYLEEYLNGDPERVFRQRIVSFNVEDDIEVRMKLYFLKDARRYRGAYQDPDLLAALTPADANYLPECDVYFRLSDDALRGAMRPGACAFGAGAERRYSQHDIVLNADEYARVDRTFYVETGLLAQGHPLGLPHVMRRATAEADGGR